MSMKRQRSPQQPDLSTEETFILKKTPSKDLPKMKKKVTFDID